MASIVLDTNVIVSALSSKIGASYRLFSMTGSSAFEAVVSGPLVIEYEYSRRKEDPGDDMALEVAVASGTDAIITFNHRDFRQAGTFGLRVLSPREFLESEDLL